MELRIYIDMDDVLCDYSSAHHCAQIAEPSVAYPQSQLGFYENLAPVEGSQKAMEWLENSQRFAPYILTAPSVYNPLSYTEKRRWVEKNLGFDWCNRLIISPDKSLLLGDILIDDRLIGHGQDQFLGELIQFGAVEFPDWRSITSYLQNRKA